MNAQLNSIAERYNLWERAQSSALECLENYISGTLTVDFPSLQHVNQKDFSLTRRDQRIIHPENGNTMNIFRTTFDIKLEKHNQVICGFYSFDVNEEGDAVDDWLILNDSNVG